MAQNFPKQIASLREIETTLEKSTVHFQQLRDLNRRISNFKFIDQEQNWIGEARSLVGLGDIKRQIARVMDSEFEAKGVKFSKAMAKLEVAARLAEKSGAAASSTSGKQPTPPEKKPYLKKRKVVMSGALVCYEEGANMCAQHNDVEGMVRAQMGMAMLLEMDHRFKEATSVLEKTVRICAGAGESFRAHTVRANELYAALARPPHSCDVVAIPAAFMRPTGAAHWEILNRARAIECQVYVLSAAQSGWHHASRASHGHALAVDFWGALIGDAGPGEETAAAASAAGPGEETPNIVLCDIDRDAMLHARARMPLALHRRTDVFLQDARSS
jgi:predicted amidohydrolase